MPDHRATGGRAKEIEKILVEVRDVGPMYDIAGTECCAFCSGNTKISSGRQPHDADCPVVQSGKILASPAADPVFHDDGGDEDLEEED